jgi:hypothetical protein
MTMTYQTFRSTALSVAAAAALTITAASAQNYPNAAPQQNTYPQQQNSYPQQQQNGYPDTQHRDNYPGNGQRDGDRRYDHDRDAEGPHNWTTDQIITATVHQAWILSGQNEANFFAIVRELTEISARNRNLALPDDPGAGRRAGEYIKQQARLDHDQLLYAIVDKSVRMTGTPLPQNSRR